VLAKPLALFNGPTSKGRGKEGNMKRREMIGKRRGGGEGFGPPKMLAWRPLWKQTVVVLVSAAR